MPTGLFCFRVSQKLLMLGDRSTTGHLICLNYSRMFSEYWVNLHIPLLQVAKWLTSQLLDVSTAGASKLPKPGHHSAPKEIQVFVHHEVLFLDRSVSEQNGLISLQRYQKEQKSSSMAKLITFILTPSRQDQLRYTSSLVSHIS